MDICNGNEIMQNDSRVKIEKGGSVLTLLKKIDPGVTMDFRITLRDKSPTSIRMMVSAE